MSRRASLRRNRKSRIAIDLLEERRLFAGALFAQPTSLMTGLSPMGVASADVNNDGRQDLLVASASLSTPGFYIHLGDGNGGFGTGTRVTTAYTPQSIVTGDFNHDGNADVAVAGKGLLGLSGAVEVFKGQGTGAFGTAATYAAGLGTGQLTAGDLNNDRQLDLIATNTLGGTITIMTGKADGTFNAPVQKAVGLMPTATAVADFNEDGDLDVVVNTLTSVRYFSGNGDATIDAGTTVFSFAQALSLQITKVAAVDVDNDGHSDLLVPSLNGTVNILTGKGDGTFAAPQNKLGLGLKGFASLAEDFNNDGADDIATLDYSAGKLILDSGATAADAAVQTVYNIGANPSHLDLLDVNGDSNLDLVATNSADGTVSVLVNLTKTITNGVVDKVKRHLDIFGTDGADEITIKESGSQLMVSRAGLVQNFAIADFDSVYINAGLGDDLIDFSTAKTSIYASGGYGNDTVQAGFGNDTLFGSLGNDVLDGGAGADRIGGWKGKDTIFGGEGEDRLYGDQDADRLDGNSGRDRLWGGTGNDTLSGGQSNDRLYGEDGDDRLIGSVGNDVLSGGSGKDAGDVQAGDIVDSIEVVVQ